MLASFLAALFFALNATCGTHNVRAHGPLRANLGRLIIATITLAVFGHTLGNGFHSASVPWFFISGVIGMGIGDLGTYGALPLLGSRLTVLMTQCLAAPIAAIGERIWLGTRLTVPQVAWGALILGGVAIAIMPSKSHPPRVRVRPLGFLFGLLAAAGQGLGALVSRKGVMVATDAGESVHNAIFGLTAAYQRILAGLVFTGAWFIAVRMINRTPTPPTASPALPDVGHRGADAAADPKRHAKLWLLANGLAGPVFAVGCYQWALATTPSGIVLPIAATSPLLAIPVAYWFEGDRPTRRAILGGVIAVAGCIALTASR
jgi:drug/metabolite transporter (DMT)-like permease